MKTLSITLALTAFAVFETAFAQESITDVEKETAKTFEISGYVDAYYAYYTNELKPNAFQPYTTVSPRSGRFGLNIAAVGLHYRSEKIRSNITLHYGDIPQATWSPEFPQIQEANVGFRLGQNWWLDAGFFTTHIGTESFLPKKNALSSTAIVTYNEPFYQAGAKLSYVGSEKWSVQLWAVNGYNFYLDKNDAKSFGALLSYQISENTSITYTNLLGKESLDSISPSQFRTYHNLYLNTQLGENLSLTLGGDLGTQSNSELGDPEGMAVMYGGLATLRYQFDPKWSVTTRGEIFNDENGFISGVFPTTDGSVEGLRLWGITLGGEYKPVENAYIRLEVRYLQADENTPIFTGDFGANERLEAMITVGYSFSKLFSI